MPISRQNPFLTCKAVTRYLCDRLSCMGLIADENVSHVMTTVCCLLGQARILWTSAVCIIFWSLSGSESDSSRSCQFCFQALFTLTGVRSDWTVDIRQLFCVRCCAAPPTTFGVCCVRCTFATQRWQMTMKASMRHSDPTMPPSDADSVLCTNLRLRFLRSQ